MINFNINEMVKVKLNPTGLEELKRQHEDLKQSTGYKGSFSEPKVDADGYSLWQLWVLMSTFGQMMINGGEPPFETEIIIVDRGANG